MTEATTPNTPAQPPLPDHLSVNPRSPHHVAAVFEHDIGIRLNGKERFDVEEYCISEGWVKVPAGKTVDRKASRCSSRSRARSKRSTSDRCTGD